MIPVHGCAVINLSNQMFGTRGGVAEEVLTSTPADTRHNC